MMCYRVYPCREIFRYSCLTNNGDGLYAITNFLLHPDYEKKNMIILSNAASHTVKIAIPLQKKSVWVSRIIESSLLCIREWRLYKIEWKPLGVARRFFTNSKWLRILHYPNSLRYIARNIFWYVYCTIIKQAVKFPLIIQDTW